MNEAVLVGLILLPLVVTYILKSNAVLAFLALCGGYTLQSFAGTDIKNLLNTTNSSFITSDSVSLLLILLPAFITLIVCRGPSSRKLDHPKVVINLLASIALGSAFLLTTVPYFAYIGSVNLTNSQAWDFLNKAQSEIIGIGVLLSLIFIWLNHRKPHSKKHK